MVPLIQIPTQALVAGNTFLDSYRENGVGAIKFRFLKLNKINGNRVQGTDENGTVHNVELLNIVVVVADNTVSASATASAYSAKPAMV